MHTDSKDAMNCAYYRINEELIKDIQSALMSIIARNKAESEKNDRFR